LEQIGANFGKVLNASTTREKGVLSEFLRVIARNTGPILRHI